MLKGLMRTTFLACGVGLFALATEAQGAATVSLKAVAKNGAPIAPTNALPIVANDTITAEVWIFGWNNPIFDASGANTGLVRTYQAALLGEMGAIGQSDGSAPHLVLPVGWDAPLDRLSCPCTDPVFTECDALYGCVGTNHAPNNMASINIFDPDFIFTGFDSQSAADVSSVNIRFGGTILFSEGQGAGRCVGGPVAGFGCTINADCLGGTCNAFNWYAGTLNLKVGTDPCGQYTFTFDNEIVSTFIANPAPIPDTVLPIIQGLVLTAPNACAAGGPNLVSSSPSHCTVDARIPFPANTPAQRRGFQDITLNFDGPAGGTEDSAGDYTITQDPSGLPAAPTIQSVTLAGNSAMLHLSAPIQPQKWTCIQHNLSNKRVCIGFLPADTNSNLASAPADILELIDHLNGVRNPPLQIHQCDIDRTDVCNPSDILTEIDLLNGANSWPAMNGRTLTACPSMTP